MKVAMDMIENGNADQVAQGLKTLKGIADAGNWRACVTFGTCCLNGSGGIGQDPKTAIEYFQRAKTLTAVPANMQLLDTHIKEAEALKEKLSADSSANRPR